jgi:hypothetical protein
MASKHASIAYNAANSMENQNKQKTQNNNSQSIRRSILKCRQLICTEQQLTILRGDLYQFQQKSHRVATINQNSKLSFKNTNTKQTK